MTTIGFKTVGTAANIETDMIGKYVARFVTGEQIVQPQACSGGVDLNLLAKSGFLGF